MRHQSVMGNKNICVLLDIISRIFNSCKFLFIIICRKVNPAEEIVASA